MFLLDIEENTPILFDIIQENYLNLLLISLTH
jgi:hypothetical protein